MAVAWSIMLSIIVSVPVLKRRTLSRSIGGDLDRPARHGVTHVVERMRRQREQDRGRLGRVSIAIGPVAGVHDVAGIDHADAHAAVARRDDGGVIELGLGGFDGGPSASIEALI